MQAPREIYSLDVHASARLLLCLLWSYLDSRRLPDAWVYPTTATLSATLGQSDRMTRKHLETLRVAGLIEPEVRDLAHGRVRGWVLADLSDGGLQGPPPGPHGPQCGPSGPDSTVRHPDPTVRIADPPVPRTLGSPGLHGPPSGPQGPQIGLSGPQSGPSGPQKEGGNLKKRGEVIRGSADPRVRLVDGTSGKAASPLFASPSSSDPVLGTDRFIAHVTQAIIEERGAEYATWFPAGDDTWWRVKRKVWDAVDKRGKTDAGDIAVYVDELMRADVLELPAPTAVTVVRAPEGHTVPGAHQPENLDPKPATEEERAEFRAFLRGGGAST